MPFMSNFVAVREGEHGLRVEGETNAELIAAAERMYVGVGPADAKTPELEVYEVDLLSDWSVPGVPREWDEAGPLTLVGVVIRKDGPPFVWAQTLGSIGVARPSPMPPDRT